MGHTIEESSENDSAIVLQGVASETTSSLPLQRNYRPFQLTSHSLQQVGSLQLFLI